MLSPLIQICDVQFRCIHYSDHNRRYSNLGQNVIESRENSSLYLIQAFSECYENVLVVLDFLETHLNYIGLDGHERSLILNVNCADYCQKSQTLCHRQGHDCDYPKPACDFPYAYFVLNEGIEQFIFGQRLIDDNTVSLSECLTIVAHEIFHAVTHFSCDLSYNDNMSAALHESYSDIFAVLVNNRNNPDIDTWSWVVGDGYSKTTRSLNSERHMSTYDNGRNSHYNMGIHNYAVFKIITMQDISGQYLFNNKTAMLPILFYKALKGFGQSKNKINRSFIDSRAAIESAAKSYFDSEIIEAIQHAFDSLGIPPPSSS